MRCLVIAAVLLATLACQRTPEQQHANALRNAAIQQGAAIENQADGQADALQQQASDLQNQAAQAGGMTGERLKIRAGALEQESKVIRKQGDMQADAIKEHADARIKASKSR
jgi:hypothetical protein